MPKAAPPPFAGGGVPNSDLIPTAGSAPTMTVKAGPVPVWAGLALDRPRIMGVLNVTPDSFSDGGDFLAPDAAIAAGHAMAAAGADIIDVGGESTRPRAQPTPPDLEQARILPVIRGLASAGLRVSVDTRHAPTMAAALDAGAAIVNDVSALGHDPDAAPLIAARGCCIVLMHMRGSPADMYAEADYDDVVLDVRRELAGRIAAAERGGVASDRIAIDPGIGFAKRPAQSMELLRRLPVLAALGYPVLVGVSRKSFMAGITREVDPRRRLPGSLAAGLFALSRGAAILRVHDVAETVQAIAVWQKLVT
jgi:dihydropteroate synthase